MNFPPSAPPADIHQEAHHRLVRLFNEVQGDSSDEALVGGIFAATIRHSPSPELATAICRAAILDPVYPAPTETGWAVALYDLDGTYMGRFTYDHKRYHFSTEPIGATS